MLQREIVTLNIGGCGVNLGESTLRQYSAEQGISCDGSKEQKTSHDDSIRISFEETSRGKYRHRSLMVDLDPYSIHQLKQTSTHVDLFNENYLISGKCSAANNYALAHYGYGEDIMDTVSNQLRRLVESCDKLQGFILHRSMSGGTGSGLGSLLMTRLAIDYRKRCVVAFEVFPHRKRSSSPLYIYNMLLSFHETIDGSSISIPLDNEMLETHCKDKLGTKSRFKNVNSLINKLCSSVTAASRFSENAILNSMVEDLIPFPRLHFLTSSMSPIIGKKKQSVVFDQNLTTLVNQVVDSRYFFQFAPDYDCDEDKYMAMAMCFRGKNNQLRTNSAVRRAWTNRKFTWVEWCSGEPCVKCIDSVPAILQSDDIVESDRHVTMLGNNTWMSRMFAERISKYYDRMYKQRSYVHHLVGYGLEEGELATSREDLNFLEKDYLLCKKL